MLFLQHSPKQCQFKREPVQQESFKNEKDFKKHCWKNPPAWLCIWHFKIINRTDYTTSITNVAETNTDEMTSVQCHLVFNTLKSTSLARVVGPGEPHTDPPWNPRSMCCFSVVTKGEPCKCESLLCTCDHFLWMVTIRTVIATGAVGEGGHLNTEMQHMEATICAYKLL